MLGLGREHGVEFLVSCEGGSPAQVVAQTLGIAWEGLEREAGRRSRYSHTDLGALAALLVGRPAGTVVLAYAGEPKLRRALRAAGHRLAAPDGGARAALERKDRTRRWLAACSVPCPATQVILPEDLDYERQAARLGARLVVQAPLGSAGQRTHLADSPEALETIRRRLSTERTLLVSPFLEGPCLSIHVLVGPSAVEVSAPIVQVVGPPELSDHPFAYCGGDLGSASALGFAALARARTLARRIGALAGARGWRGLLGVDVLLDHGEVPVVLEINPRLQASTWLLAEAEAAVGADPLGRAHRDLMLGTGDSRRTPRPRPEVLEGAFLVLHQQGNAVVSGIPATGVHRLVDGVLEWVRPGVGLLGCGSEEVSVEGLPPGGGAYVEDGAVLGRICTWRQVVSTDSRTLTSWGRALARALDQAVVRVPVLTRD